jgi:hypothetical protein
MFVYDHFLVIQRLGYWASSSIIAAIVVSVFGGGKWKSMFQKLLLLIQRLKVQGLYIALVELRALSVNSRNKLLTSDIDFLRIKPDGINVVGTLTSIPTRRRI